MYSSEDMHDISVDLHLMYFICLHLQSYLTSIIANVVLSSLSCDYSSSKFDGINGLRGANTNIPAPYGRLISTNNKTEDWRGRCTHRSEYKRWICWLQNYFLKLSEISKHVLLQFNFLRVLKLQKKHAVFVRRLLLEPNKQQNNSSHN